MAPFDGVAAPLRHTVFRRIWLASLLSNLGLLIQGVGAAWAMTQMTSSADKVALVQTALMLPVMLISMPAGAIADMYDRRIVALVSLSIALVGATALSVLARLGLVTPPPARSRPSPSTPCFIFLCWWCCFSGAVPASHRGFPVNVLTAPSCRGCAISPTRPRSVSCWHALW
jgi:MFS family permease